MKPTIVVVASSNFDHKFKKKKTTSNEHVHVIFFVNCFHVFFFFSLKENFSHGTFLLHNILELFYVLFRENGLVSCYFSCIFIFKFTYKSFKNLRTFWRNFLKKLKALGKNLHIFHMVDQAHI